MKRALSIWPLTLPGIFFVLISIGSCGLEKDKQKVQNLFADTTLKAERAEIVEIRYSDSGILKAVIYAPMLDRYPSESPYSVMDKGLTGYFYGANGKVENSLKANYAISYEKEKLIEVRNDVRLTNIKKETLNTEKLTWDQKTQKIYTDQFVKITTPDNIIYGTGFESNQNFTEYRIFNVKGKVKLKENEKAD